MSQKFEEKGEAAPVSPSASPPRPSMLAPAKRVVAPRLEFGIPAEAMFCSVYGNKLPVRDTALKWYGQLTPGEKIAIDDCHRIAIREIIACMPKHSDKRDCEFRKILPKILFYLCTGYFYLAADGKIHPNVDAPMEIPNE